MGSAEAVPYVSKLRGFLWVPRRGAEIAQPLSQPRFQFLVFGGKHRGNDSDYHFSLAAAWRVADLAVQHGLGLLSQRWTWIGAAHNHRAGLDGSGLT